AIAQEVTSVLTEKGYKVFVQDYDIPLTANFIEEMHEAVKNSRDLVVLFTRDYEQSPYTRIEFTSFEANAAQSAEHRRMVILRCEDAPFARSVRATRLSRPCWHRRRRGAQEPYSCRSGRTFAGIGAAATTVHRGATAYRKLHRSRQTTGQARRHSDAGHTRCRDTGVSGSRCGAGHGRRR